MTSRKRAYKFGLNAERLAKFLLICKGYRILASRYKTKVGEIDIVASRAKTLCFIEVKARRSADDAIHALTWRQQKRIINAARAWMMKHDDCKQNFMRFDVILVAPDRWPRHIKDAFQAD